MHVETWVIVNMKTDTLNALLSRYIILAITVHENSKKTANWELKKADCHLNE